MCFFEKGWCFGIALFYDVYFRKSACMFVNFGILSFLFSVPSSSGLGRGPLKAATRVQIPLGSPMQTVGIKTCRFYLFYLFYAGWKVVFLNITFWEVFTNSLR